MKISLGDVCRSQALKLPRETAIVFGDRRITYLDHYRRAAMLSHALYQAGVRHQDRIAVYAQNSIEYLEIFAAAELAGFIVTTVNFRLAPPEVRHILTDSAPRMVFFDRQYLEVIEGIRRDLPGVHFVCIGDERPWARSYDAFQDAGSVDGAPFRSSSDDVMHIIYTSGTTGRPKGVMRTHRAEIAMAEFMTAEVGVLTGDRVLAMMPLFHVGARWLQLGTFLRGSTLVLHREFDPVEVLRTIEAERINVTLMAPTIIHRVLEHPQCGKTDLSSLHTLYYSSAPMPVPLLQKGLERLGPVFVQLYGMTESGGTTLHKRNHRPDGSDEDRARLKSVGQAPYSVDIRIVDDSGKDCPSGSVGEVLTCSETHMLGYWNNEAATADAMRGGWYHTGDLGYLDAERFLFLVDRKKDMIVSGGENIYSREVEVAIAAHPAVSEVAVVGIPDEVWGEAVLAAIVVVPGAKISAAEIIDHCRAEIASYKKPKHVVFVEALPRVTTGKVDKARLRAMHRDRR